MRKLTFVATALMLVALSAPPARSGTPSPTKCTGTLGSVTISGDLLVPAGEFCSLLRGTTVTGNVTVQGSLFTERAYVSGNLIGDHADSISLTGSVVGGNLLADDTTGGPNTLCDSAINGNVTIQQSSSGSDWEIGRGAVCEVGVTVGQNLTFQNNLGHGDITDNHIAGNLDCHNNTLAPSGFLNTVGGNTEGQCTGF